jgi:diacylglycerol kinase (ATP)
MKGQSFFNRLRFAIQGLQVAFLREASFRFHSLAIVVVVAVLWATGASLVWWAIGALTVSLILVTELMNTAVETLSDHLHPKQHPEIKAVKDLAAGAVLVASLAALFVAVVFCLR